MNPTQRALLSLIRERPGIRPQEIVAATGLPRTTIVENLGDLHVRGIVRVGMRASDARSRCYYLTHACAACDTPILDGTTFRERHGERWHPACYPEAQHG